MESDLTAANHRILRELRGAFSLARFGYIHKSEGEKRQNGEFCEILMVSFHAPAFDQGVLDVLRPQSPPGFHLADTAACIVTCLVPSVCRYFFKAPL